MSFDSVHAPKQSLTETLFALFLRFVSASCVWFALNYWAMLIGFSAHGAGRFDLLSLPWRVAGTTLAVVYPVAALGLWLMVSWGPVLWVVAAGVEIAMFVVYPDVFGHRPLIPLLHIVVAVLFVIFRLAIYRQRVIQRRASRVDLP